MKRFTFKQRCDLLEIYFKDKGNWSGIERKYCTEFDNRKKLTVPGKRQLISKVRETGFSGHALRLERVRTVHSPENIKAVTQSMRENPSTSPSHRP